MLDADISQHTGIVRFGNDALDRWGACAALAAADRIAEAIGWL